MKSKLMKDRLSEVSDKLNSDIITEDRAKEILLDILGISPLLKFNAKDFLISLENWKDYELKNGMEGHKIVKMRPMLLAKSVCEAIVKNNP